MITSLTEALYTGNFSNVLEFYNNNDIGKVKTIKISSRCGVTHVFGSVVIYFNEVNFSDMCKIAYAREMDGL